MQTKHKIGLGLFGIAAAAGLAYCAFLHKDDILSKIDELKKQLEAKKAQLGEAGAEKIAHIAESLITFLEKYNSCSKEMTAEEIRAQIKDLETKLANLN